MFRTAAPRTLLRAAVKPSAHVPRLAFNGSTPWASKMCTMAVKRPQVMSATTRFLNSRGVVNVQDTKLEQKLAEQKLPTDPSGVSTTSTIHPVLGEVGGTHEQEKDVDMMKGVKSDFQTIKETFSLDAVPPQALVVGLAGVVPYLATSLTTVYCAWEINNAHAGSGFMMSGKSAELLLQLIEPLQIGYGAVIISFLGAIHWGLEWGGYAGSKGYSRYAIGIFAPAIAWPTILLPPIYALTTQFLAFTSLYYIDARATRRGWTPPWYDTYRFVLTFIVGASIVLSLIGRGEIADRVERLPSPLDRFNAFRDNAAEELSRNEEAFKDKITQEAKKLKEEAE